jgi:hypothetical protein
MPNRITSGIHGGTTDLPYTDELVYDEYQISMLYPRPYFHIRPGGWLTAIMVRKHQNNLDMHFEITDGDYNALYGEFTVYPQMNCGGLILPEPIPNVNTACGYWLKLPENMCDITVISVNRMMNRGTPA